MKELVRTQIRSALAASFAAANLLLIGAAAAPAQNPNDPEGKPIADVIPLASGRLPVPKEQIRAAIQTQPGRPYSRATLAEDVRALSKTYSFADIKAWPRMTTDGRVIVYFQFETRQSKIKEIIYNGAKHVKRDDLDSVTGLKIGMPMNPAANRRAAHALTRYYHEKGRLLANVVLVEGDKPTDQRVVFNITEGPVAKVSKIIFEGNTFVSDARLQTQIYSAKQWLRLIGGTFDPRKADEDVLKLAEYYRRFGFHDVKVSRELKWEDDMRHVQLIFHIDEGPRYKVSTVSIHGNSVFSEDELLRLVSLQPGENFNQNTVEKDVRNLTDYYGYRGYNAPVRAEPYFPQDRPGEVDVHYNVVEQPPDIVGQIFIVGNRVTRQNVILRQLQVYPGQVLSYPDLRLSEQNLARLNIFETNPQKGIRPTVTVLDSDSHVKDILVQVQETQTGSLLFGLGVNSDAGLTGSIVLNERNFDIFNPPTSIEDILEGRAFRGGGQEFRLEAVPGTRLQRYTISFREPFLFDSQFSLGLSGYYYTRIFTEYDETRRGGRINIGRRLNDVWTASFGLRLESVRVAGVPFFAPTDFTSVIGDNLLIGLSGGLTRDTRDSYLRPTEGSILELSFEQVLGDFDFPTGSIDVNKYWTTYERPDGSGRHVLAARTRLAVTGNAPVFERLYAGGFRTLRGFQFRGVGPDVLGFKTGGEFMFLNSIEYQVPLRANDQLYLVGFVDSGTVESDFAIRDYRVTVGLGARIIVPMMGPVPIALDFGIPIVKGPGDREQIFSFWVGFFN